MSEGKGTIYIGQIHLSRPATESTHAVRSDDSRLADLTNGRFAMAGYPIAQLVSGNSGATNGNAVYIKSDGTIANAFSTMLEPTIPFVMAGDRLFTSGTVAKNFGTNLFPGKAYWLTAFGPPSTVAPTTAGEWVVRVGIAINSTDILVDLQVMGTV